MTQFSRTLYQHRLEKGLSQRSLAQSIGLTAGIVCRYESGKRIPSIPTILKISNTLGVDETTFIDAIIYDAREKINGNV